MNDNKIKDIVSSCIKTNGLLSHVKESMNNAYETGIPLIVTNQFKIDDIIYDKEKRGIKEVALKSRNLQYARFKLEATKAFIHKPRKTLSNGQKVPYFPNAVRRDNAVLDGDLEVEYKAELTAIDKNGKLIQGDSIVKTLIPTSIPILVGSKKCHTYNLTMPELLAIGENPLEDGGIIINGENSYAIDCIEKTNPYNTVNVYYEKNYGGISSHSNILSKPGILYENSYETRCILRNNGELMLVLSYNMFDGIEIPFFLFFRLLDCSSDLDITKYILNTHDIESPAYQNILRYVIKGFQVVNKNFESFRDIYDPIEIKNKLIQEVFKVNNKFKAKEELFNILSTYLLPHVGIGPEHKNKKCFFLGLMIRKTIMVSIDKTLQTNRDALNEKLVQTPGELFSQHIIKFYNKYFISHVRSKIDDALHKTPFEDINLNEIFKSIESNNKLKKKLLSSLSSGNVESDSGGTASARYQTQRLHVVPDVAIKNACRVIRIARSSAHGKKTRSNAVRETKPSYDGYIDMTQTHDTGDKVGTVKSISITCLLTQPGDFQVYEYLKNDILLLTDDIRFSEFAGKGIVLLNGEPIGFVDNIYELYKKYVQLRRQRKIEKYIGIHCDVRFNMIDFRTDSSRPTRPLLIVKNSKEIAKEKGLNKKEIEKIPFEQDILFTEEMWKELVLGKISIDDLCDLGVIEWIDCREAVNSVYCAQSYEALQKSKGDSLNPFTHCELLASFYGVACGTQPFSNHNTDSRTSYQSKVVKQACATPSYERYPLYKDMYRQSINDKQLTKTLVTDFLTPYGKSIKLGIMSYRGHTQEDSIIINGGLMDRGCYFVIKEDIISIKIEPNEVICMPDKEITEDIKIHNYDKLKDGIIAKGVIINYGDILVSKRIANKRGAKGKKFLDRSYTFNEKHPQLVLNWFKTSDDTGTYIRIHIREERRLRVGDKMSSTHGQKGVVSKIYPNELMPFTKSGITPDIIMGPHGFPTRKTIGQNIEGLVSKLNALQGVISDHTAFTPTDIPCVVENLRNFNFIIDKEVFYDGITGHRMVVPIVIVPCYYQRLAKFAHDSNYSVYNAAKSIFTRQAVSGHKRRGGLKFGEMEAFALITSGAVSTMKELTTTNSDAFTTYICRCGSRHTIVNEEKNMYSCKLCNDPYIVAHQDSFTSNIIMNQVMTLGVGIKTHI